MVDERNKADFFLEFEYGISEKIKFINYPVYKYIGKGDNIIYQKKRNNFEFKIKTKSPRSRILIGHKTLRDVVYHRYLDVDIISSENLRKVYQGKVKSEGKIDSLPYVMHGLMYSLFVDFPGNSYATNIYELTEEIYNPNAYQKRQSSNMEWLKKNM
tara:strand:- start:172 stop:642 length:471 start_codon:yes stop_codon:yes gene_type:complete